MYDSTQEHQRGSGSRTASSNNQPSRQHKRKKGRLKEEGSEKGRRRREDKSRKRRVREKEKRGERGKREEETGEEGKEVQEETDNEVEKDVTGWTEVTRNKRKKMVQIFVKVDGMKTGAMEVSPEDKVQKILNTVSKSDRDVYVTSGGRILKGSDKLKNCEVRDGSTVDVTSRMRGGGRHKDKKSKVEKKQVTRQEPLKSEGPAILESDKDAVIRMLEENEHSRKIVDDMSGESDIEVKRKMQHWETTLQAGVGLDEGQMKVMECGFRWAVEARRQGRDEQQEQRRQAQQGQEQSKQGKQVRFGEEQQLEKTEAENAGEQE